MQDASIASLLDAAVAAHKAGDYFQAEDLYRQVLNEDPDSLAALQYLATLSLNVEQPSIAIPLLKKAISIDGNNPYLLYNLGLAFQQDRDLESAIHYYKLTLALNPDFALAHNNLGVAYQHRGDLTLANAHLERSFTSLPNCVDAYYNFAQSHKFSMQDNLLIEKIEAIYQSRAYNKDEAIKLNFTLGKIYSDLNAYKQAFIHYEKGNSLKDPGFNTAQFSQYIDQIIENYSPSIIRSLDKIPSSSKRRFVFILGMPRSGTTLFEQILASHHMVQSAGESGFVGDIIDELSLLLKSDYSYPQCVKDLTPEKLQKISTSLHNQIDNLPYSGDIITDKSPINFLHVGLILLLFPKSIVIQTNRNPIDTCLSCYFHNFDRQHQYSYNLRNLAFFYNEYSRLMSYWRSLFSDKIIEVSYEKLVNNQEEETKKLIEACDLPWDEQCLRFNESDTVVSSASKWQIRQPMYQTSVEKWRHYEAYISDLIENLGT